MDDLKNRINILSTLIGKNPVVYLDYPVYRNIGDLFIMLGTEKFLSENNYSVEFRAMGNLVGSPNITVSEDTVILLQGGGNFGDLHPRFQRYREKILENFRKNKIIILPQTIYFSSRQQLLKSADVFRRHNNLHLCVRDKQSYNIASKYFCDNVYLIPDMAHYLWPIEKRTTVKTRDVLFLIRGDMESGSVPEDLIQKKKFWVDWDDIIGINQIYVIRCFIIAHIAAHILERRRLIHKLWIRYVNWLTDRTLSFLSQHHHIVTSRLHGHLLALLLDIPCTLLDNSYGKNSAYVKSWTHSSDKLELVADLSPLRDIRYSAPV